MCVVGTLHYTPLVPWLKGRGSNLTSQFGEDGLIAGCLDYLGTTCRHCFEVGAADGTFFSNTLALRQKGWHAVLIEANALAFEKLSTTFGHCSECVHAHVDDLDRCLIHTKLNMQPDLGVIDIDGQDWHLWHDMRIFRPRIMLVEIHSNNDDAPVPLRGQPGQAGLDCIERLGKSKGYTLVARTRCNALFVEAELCER